MRTTMEQTATPKITSRKGLHTVLVPRTHPQTGTRSQVKDYEDNGYVEIPTAPGDLKHSDMVLMGIPEKEWKRRQSDHVKETLARSGEKDEPGDGLSINRVKRQPAIALGAMVDELPDSNE